MAKILSHPFRFGPAGQVVTVEQGSDQANAEQIQVLILTRTGERPMRPGFGISDPQFAGVEVTEISAGIGAYGPDVSLNAIDVAQADGSTTLVHIDYSS